MFTGFDQIAERADHYSRELVLEDIPAAELLSWGQEGTVVLIARYLPQLRKLVTRALRADAAEREDLESAAVLGFLEALERGEIGRGADPYTYVHTSIVNALHEANRLASPKPVKQSASDRFWRAMGECDNDPVRAREWSALQRLTGHALLELADDGNELAREIVDARIVRYEAAGEDVDAKLSESGRGLVPADFDAIFEALTYVSIDAPVSDAEDSTATVGDLVPSDAASNAYAAAEARMAVEAALSNVSDRDAAIVRGLYGIGCAEQSTEELAEQFGIAVSRVRTIKRDVLVKARAAA